MIWNYVTVAVRNLIANRLYTAINILGLIVGMVSVILILLIVKYEINFDSYHQNADQIYKVIKKTHSKSHQLYSSGTSGALAQAIKDNYPEVHQTIRIWRKKIWLKTKGQSYQQTFCLADNSILKTFNFSLVQGDKQTALNNPYSILITEKTAQKLFKNTNPIGKTVEAIDRHFGAQYTITGVLKDIPQNTTIRFDILTSTPILSRETVKSPWETWNNGKGWYPIQTFIQLSGNPNTLESKLPELTQLYLDTTTQTKTTYHLQPLTRVHLYTHSDYQIDDENYGNITHVYMLVIIAGFILLIACINFTNLSTAQYTKRSHEIGLRKVVGADKTQLIQQFLGESFLIVCLALLLSLALIQMILPQISIAIDRPLSLAIGHPSVILGLTFFTLSVTLLAGGYPAFFISSFSATEIFQNKSRNHFKDIGLRKTLVVFQFVISIVLIIGTTVIYKQLNFLRQKDLGFNQEQIVILPIFSRDRQTQQETEGSLTKKYDTVKRAFLEHPNILQASASVSHGAFGGQATKSVLVYPEDTPDQGTLISPLYIDESFLETYNIALLQGRNFAIYENKKSDLWSAFILNETAVKRLGWTNPIGKQLKWGWRKGVVVGVVKDFHNQSLHNHINPIILAMWRPKFNNLSLKIHTSNINETLYFIRQKWQYFLPHVAFEYEFLDDHFKQIYKTERNVGQIFAIFSFLAISLACLGTFALISFSATQRTKEIGIRKVLGASVYGLIVLLSKDFLKLVCISSLIACSIAYIASDYWLQKFVYRTSLNALPFFAGTILTIIITGITVGYHAWKAAISDPIEALHQE